MWLASLREQHPRAVTRAYDLLYAHPRVAIIDETVHRIVQTLIGIEGSSLDDIRRVESHPVALEQCRRFLASLAGVEVIAVADTAGAVRCRSSRRPLARRHRSGGKRAALRRLRSGRRDPRRGRELHPVFRHRSRRHCPAAAWARRLGVRAAHRPGSLHSALGVFADRGLNLRALVARPRPGRPFEYIFYAEIECETAELARAAAAAVSDEVRLLGWY